MADKPNPLSLGELIRRQRELAEVPMRQLAAMTGISNPYLSQIENGLREPSGRVLNALAESLQMSVDELTDAARGSGATEQEGRVLESIRDDHGLTAKQRQALAEVYKSMVEATKARRKRA